MSADNWRECPICKADIDAQVAQISAHAKSQYGKVSLDEYLAADARANKEIGKLYTSNVEMFREDYSVGITDQGTFMVGYSGHCEKCGASFNYTFEKPNAVQPGKKKANA